MKTWRRAVVVMLTAELRLVRRIVSGVWELDYFRKSPTLLRLIAGGWSLAGIATFRSGTPLTITAGSDVNFDGNTNDRADLIGSNL